MKMSGVKGVTTAAYEWEFKSRFRRHAFGWRSQPAIQRIKQAASEIKKVARRDPVLGGEGAVMLLEHKLHDFAPTRALLPAEAPQYLTSHVARAVARALQAPGIGGDPVRQVQLCDELLDCVAREVPVCTRSLGWFAVRPDSVLRSLVLRTWQRRHPRQLLFAATCFVDAHTSRAHLLGPRSCVRCYRAGQTLSVTAKEVLLNIDLVRVNDRVLRLASELPPPTLRTLDAIHLATARLLGGSLGRLVTYDQLMLDAARLLGVTLASPV